MVYIKSISILILFTFLSQSARQGLAVLIAMVNRQCCAKMVNFNPYQTHNYELFNFETLQGWLYHVVYQPRQVWLRSYQRWHTHVVVKYRGCVHLFFLFLFFSIVNSCNAIQTIVSPSVPENSQLVHMVATTFQWLNPCFWGQATRRD